MYAHSDLLRVIELQTEVAELGPDLAGVMDLVVRRAMALVGADGAAIELADGDDVVYRAASGIATSSLGRRVPRQGSLSGACLRERQALHCTDSETDPRVDQQACRAVGLRAMVVVPLVHEGEAVGVLKAMAVRPGAFDERAAGLLAMLSRAVGTAMYWGHRPSHDDMFLRATQDDLTGLANRSAFLERLKQAMHRAGREGAHVVVVVIDMDGLKAINDRHGHAAGDAALSEFARRLRRSARTGDVVARIGGDEFALVLSASQPPEAAQSLIERLERAMTEPHEVEGRAHRIEGSCGTAVFPHDAQDLDALLAVADDRMYEAKRRRKTAAATRPGGLH